MNKKTPILVLASALLLGGLAGCGGSSPEGGSSAATSETTSQKSEEASTESKETPTPESEETSSTGKGEETSESEKEPEHVHSYNADHICATDGYSEPGALSVDLDGALSDAKWAALDKAHSLFDLGEDGRGLKIKGFTDDTYAYFAFEIISNTNAFQNIEIIFNGDISTQTTVTIGEDGYTKWGANFIGAVAKVNSLEGGHYQTIVELAAKKSVVAPNGNLGAAFGAVIAGEKSSSSFSDTQIEYWVLKGINPWGGSNFAVDAEGIHHTHSYKDGKCVWCDEPVPAAPMAIDPDGDPSDWNEAIAKKYIGTSDAEGRHFGWNAFTDDTYLYVTSTLIHSSAHVTQLHMLRLDEGAKDATEENIAVYGASGYSYGGTGLIKGGYKETLDEASGLTKTVFEFVFLKASWTVGDKVNIGLLAHVPAESDSSEHFDINHSGIPGYWGINSSSNAWGVGGRFDVTSEGVVHTHSYSGGFCTFCGEPDPNAGKTYDIALDGDLSDWDADVLATKVSDSDPAGPALSMVGFKKNGYIYIAMSCTHKKVIWFNLVTKDGKELFVSANDGEFALQQSTSNYVESFGGKDVTDEETGYTTSTVEIVIPEEKLVSPELGFCVQAMAEDETSSALHLASNGWTGHFWVIKQLNSWGYRFGFSENGLTHEHTYKDGKCVICGFDEPEPVYTPAITLDGDISDFSDAAKNTRIAKVASNGESIALSGFADDHFAYLGIEVKTTSANVSNVDLCATDNSIYRGLSVVNGVISSTNTDVKCASTRSYDEDNAIYSYVFEIAVEKAPFLVNGTTKIGVSVNGCSSNADLTCNPNDPSYWGINNLNAWWGEAHCFTFSADGLAAPAKA